MRPLVFLLFALSIYAWKDVVMERQDRRVEWDDLFTEYDKLRAFNPRFMTINITVLLFNKVSDDRINTVVFETVQSWSDERLQFSGDFTVTVPGTLFPWKPDTYVSTAQTHQVTKESLRLRSDGVFFWKQRHVVTLPSKEELLTFASFDNEGSDEINYYITGISHVKENKKPKLNFNQTNMEFATSKEASFKVFSL